MIAGYTRGSGSRAATFGSLVLAVNEGGELRYAGNVGTGFDDREIRTLLEMLRPLERPDPPFARAAEDAARPRGRRHLGRAAARGRGRVQRVDARRPRPPALLQGAARRQARRRGAARAARRPTSFAKGSASCGSRTSTSSSGPTRGSRRATSSTTTGRSRRCSSRTCAAGRSRCAATPTARSARRSSRRTRRRTCPTGSGPSGRPSRRAAAKERKEVDFPLVDDELALLWMVNMGCIDMNPWYSRVDRPDRPDFVLFDLDPTPEVPYAQTVEVALLVKALLDGLGLASFPKTSGGKGFHILVPLDRRSTYDDSRSFAELVAGTIARAYPKLATTQWAKSKRRGVLIDANQNGMGKTIASVYSVRPHPGAPVSTPLALGRGRRRRSTRPPSRWGSCSTASSGTATSTPACSRRGSRSRRRSVSSRKGADVRARLSTVPWPAVRSRRLVTLALVAGCCRRTRRLRRGQELEPIVSRGRARRQAGRRSLRRRPRRCDRARPARRPRSQATSVAAPSRSSARARRRRPARAPRRSRLREVWFDCFPDTGRRPSSGPASS